VLDLVYAYGNSTGGYFTSADPIAAYQFATRTLAAEAHKLGANAVINIRLDYRVATTEGWAGAKQVFEVFGYGTAVKIL